MKKGVIFLFFIIFLSFLILSYADFSLAAECTKDEDCPEGQACVKGECVKARALEITYPVIPGIPTPKYVSTGLPDYINYIFRISIWIIGLLILGTLIYGGVSYLTSFGSQTKLSEAKKRIFSAFLGGIILLSAYLIFNTINPQLVILELAEIELVKPYIIPGVYLCDYNYADIETDLQSYMEGDEKERIEAVKKFKEKMGTAESKDKCFRVTASGLLRDIDIRKNSTDYTVFIVPREKYNPDDPEKPLWEYEYGIVFHENDKYGEKCKLLPEPPPETAGIENFMIYHQVWGFNATLDFNVKSLTLFQKSATPISEIAEGVILYEGLQYNEIGKEEEEEEEGETGNQWFQKLASIISKEILSSFISVFAQERDPKLAMKAFKPSGDAEALFVPKKRLEEVVPQEAEAGHQGLYQNTRSIEFGPKGSYLAVLIGDSEKKCGVREKNDANLTDNPIGRCGKCSLVKKLVGWVWGGKECHPCLEKMYVVEGQKL